MQHETGDLITLPLNRKFPVVLRGGPGYVFPRKKHIEPGQIAIVLDVKLGHGSHLWVNIFVGGDNIGWLPCSLIEGIEIKNVL